MGLRRVLEALQPMIQVDAALPDGIKGLVCHSTGNHLMMEVVETHVTDSAMRVSHHHDFLHAQLILIAFGGAAGSVLRYLLSNINTSFPWGTFTVNILGSLLIGLLVGFASKGVLSPEMKLLLVTGFCGGFTTFSTFANESFGMMKAGDVLLILDIDCRCCTVGTFEAPC